MATKIVFFSINAKNIIKIAKKEKLLPKMHLCINSGMNRYGVKDIKEFVKIIKLLEKNKIELEGIYTHFSMSGIFEAKIGDFYAIFTEIYHFLLIFA